VLRYAIDDCAVLNQTEVENSCLIIYLTLMPVLINRAATWRMKRNWDVNSWMASVEAWARLVDVLAPKVDVLGIVDVENKNGSVYHCDSLG